MGANQAWTRRPGFLPLVSFPLNYCNLRLHPHCPHCSHFLPQSTYLATWLIHCRSDSPRHQGQWRYPLIQARESYYSRSQRAARSADAAPASWFDSLRPTRCASDQIQSDSWSHETFADWKTQKWACIQGRLRKQSESIDSTRLHRLDVTSMNQEASLYQFDNTDIPFHHYWLHPIL